MNIEKFKKESKVTYVHIVGRPTGVIVPRNKQDFSHDDFLYNGFIEVPFSYDNFMSLSDEQQRAICEATLCKLGHPVKVSGCNVELFYSSVKESKFDKKIKEIQDLLKEEKPDETTKRRVAELVEEICSSNDEANREYICRIINLSRCFIDKSEFISIAVDYIQPRLGTLVQSKVFDESRNDIIDIVKQLFKFDIEKGEPIDDM